MVLIVPDKFKGTLTADQAAAAIASGWRQSRPQDQLTLLPMSDGGDGFGDVLSQILQATPQPTNTIDAAHRPIHARWWWVESNRTAIIETANIIGLAQLPPGKYHPFDLDTRGIGPVLQAAADQGATRCLLGIGGSATNDAGFGMASSLGWQFLDRNDRPILRWTGLSQLARIHPPQTRPLFQELIVAVDVQNTLLGPQGCTRIYGPQKGLRPEDFAQAESCLEQLAHITQNQLQHPFSSEPGAGAAGGLGFGFRAFTHAQLQPGFSLFSQFARLDQHLSSAHLVITGEGAIDQSTVMGKGVGQIAKLCQHHHLPCIGLAGITPLPDQTQDNFTQLHALTPHFTTRDQAIAHPAASLEKLAQHVAKNWNRP